MANGGRIGKRNVLGVDGYGGVWSLREVADALRKGIVIPDDGDFFDTDTTAQYTQYADTNATWAISGGELVATGGDQAVFVRNGISDTDVAIEVDCNFADDGGMVLRFIDNNNYYLLTIIDDSGSTPSQNFIIYKRVAGTFTALGSSSNITWPRGTSKTIKFRVSGTTLTAYVDGTQVISTTDSALAGPGGVGMRNKLAGKQSKYQAFRWGV